MLDRKPDAARSPIGFAGPGDSLTRLARLQKEFCADLRRLAHLRPSSRDGAFHHRRPRRHPPLSQSRAARENRVINGATAETAFNMVISRPPPRLHEPDRRKAGAVGTPIRLADGDDWLLARPVFSVRCECLTRPRVNRILDRMFEEIAAGETVSLQNALQIAACLLLENYALDDTELAELLTTATGEQTQSIVNAVVDAIFGSEDDARTYTDWVRAACSPTVFIPSKSPRPTCPT